MAASADTGLLPTWAQNILNDLNPVGSIENAVNGLTGNWFSSIGGQIASSIEGGIDAIFSDLWKVVIGPLEIILGSVIILIALAFIMSDDLFKLAPLLA